MSRSGAQSFSGKAAVAGIGLTALTRASGATELALAAEAARGALDDAGIAPREVDAILTYHLNDSAPATALARELRLERIGWHNEFYGGGTQCASILGDAAMLVGAGLARVVLLYRALNGRSGKRMNTLGLRLGEGVEEQFTQPFGMTGPVHQFALAAQRYLHDAKLGPEHTHAVVASSRDYAAANPRAMRRDPVTLDGYMASPLVASPLRRADCCQETDGACALVITPAAHPAAGAAPRIHAVARAGGAGCSSMDKAGDVTRIFSAYVAEPLFEAARMTPGDIDVALLYDAYSWLVPRQLEDFGLVPRSGLGEALVSRRIGPGGDLPVNPHGGLLSEGYVHGLNNVAEAVRQLRGDSAGHAPGAEVALCTGFGGSYGSAAILVAA
ncbi:MAG: thiolase C-terminal domain-containing protein [Micromonosporaceae bacterium]